MRMIWCRVSEHAAAIDWQLQLLPLIRFINPSPVLGKAIALHVFARAAILTPFGMITMAQQAFSHPGPPDLGQRLPKPHAPESIGAKRATGGKSSHGSLSMPGQSTAITVDSSEASPHCFLYCPRCGLERSLLLPMAACDFSAALVAFAASHTSCQR